MPDIGHQETDAIIEQLERRLTREYTQAERELAEKLNDYFRRFQIKDEIWRQKAVGLDKNSAEYLKWQSDYKAWRVAQLTAGARWEATRDTIAQDLHNANVNARAIITGEMPTVYALNHNFETYQIEKAGKVNTSYTLYNRDAVERLAKDDPDLLKPPGVRKNAEFDAFDKYKAGESVDLKPAQKKAFDKLIAENKDIRWQKGQIQSVTMQSILQGESIPNMARRIARTMGETNRKQSIMYARTAMTSAQNAGRLKAQRRAEEMGVNLKREWIATLDMRTRHAHRQLDGQIRGTDEPFEVDGEEIMFPGDPTASAYLIYNCRCTVGSKVDGWESKSGALRDDSAIDGMSYDEWKEGHSQSQDIESQEKKGEAIRKATIREVYGAVDNSEESAIIEENGSRGVARMSYADKATEQDRGIYSKSTGQTYTATKGDTVQLKEFVAEKQPDGEYKRYARVTGERTIPGNTTDGVIAFGLPRGGIIDQTPNAVLTDGRIALNYYSMNNYARQNVMDIIKNEMYVCSGERKDGVYYRVIGSDKEIGYIKRGTIRPSVNHMTGEKEEGLSVWEIPKYGGGKVVKVTGDVISVGSDGEPILDISTIKYVGEVDTVKMYEDAIKAFCREYNWTEEQVRRALNGAIELRR